MKDYLGKMVRQKRPKDKDGNNRDTAKVTIVKNGIRHTYSLGRYGSKEADQAYKKLAAQFYSDSLSFDQDKMKIAHLLADYLQHTPLKKGTPKTYRIKKVIRLCIEVIGEDTCSSFSFASLAIIKERILEDCKANNLTQTYANQLLSAAKSIFTYGVLKGWLDGKVLPVIKAYPMITGTLKPLKKREAVSDDVVETTLKYMKQPYVDIIRLIRSACLRPCELLRIRKSDIEVKDGCWVVRVKSKTERYGYSRIIVFNQKEQEILKNRIKEDSELLFCTNRKTPVKELNLIQNIKKAIQRANRNGENIPRWTAYQLRHAAFTENAEKYGVEIASKIAGHANLNMARIYDHSTESILIKLAQEARTHD
ncbi:MAG: tyrosine-type recombinase/integrase [Thermoguttaceae bacterium]|nr:tyrosine-type recombinase/integrase [Thermoguttaceae bacterium]